MSTVEVTIDRYFRMSMLGRDNVAVYDGSLEEWSADPNLPMEKEK